MSASQTDASLDRLWEAVDSLLAEATLSGIQAHKLGALAAHRLRRLGEPVPEVLGLEQRAASYSTLAAVPLVERLRAGFDGPLVLIKGPEVASLYPGHSRRFRDIDVLTTGAEAVQHALLAGGFVEVDDPEAVPQHHLPPIKLPTIGLEVEVHTTPNWPRHARRPPLGEILEASVPSATQVDGVLAPTPTHHALILASHAWVHEPLRTLRDLVDIAAVSALADRRELERIAQAWGIGRIWRTTDRAIDALFYGGSQTFPLRSWARHLEPVRERSRLESYLEWLSHGFWEVPVYKAPLETLRALRVIVTPDPGESWGKKLKRLPRALLRLRAPVAREGLEQWQARDRREPPP